MSIYSGKLLELKGIKFESNRYFLEVKLSFEQEIDFFRRLISIQLKI